MSKKTKVIIMALGGLLIVVAGVFLLFWFNVKPISENKKAQKTTLSYFADSQISKEDKSLIAKALESCVAQSVCQQVSEKAFADLVISGNYQEGYEQLAVSTIPQPLNLTSDIIIQKKASPRLYIYSNAGAEKIKAELISAFNNDSQKQSSWNLNVAGDIIIGRTVYEQQMRRNDYTSSFALVKDMLASADFTIANAEWTAADGIAHPLMGMSFSSPEKSLDGLSYAGIDAVSLANNHSMNGGVAAFERMMASLNTRKIGYFGAGKNFAEAHSPYVADIKGVRVAFLGYTSIPGNYEASNSTTGNAFIKIAPWYPFSEADVAQMEQDIKTAKAKADVVIPYFHWSQEYVHQPSEQMRTVAHRAIDAGATMVVGSHPHWVQGIEWYKDSLIAYSLGNFIFDQEQMLKTKQGVVLNAEFEGAKLVAAKLIPIQIEQYFQPHLLDGAAKQGVLNDVFTNSFWR